MQEEWMREIEILIELYQKEVPKGYGLWVKWKKNNLEKEENFLFFLKEFFRQEENEIAKERETAYGATAYEIGVRSFAIGLVPVLIRNRDRLSGIDTYAEILSQRHVAYAYYHLLDEEKFGELQDKECKIRMYEGLVNFYSAFYGLFADNEEAIRLLCKYYPVEENESLPYEENIINALYPHISNAGTPNDFGYAYQGIEQIRKYIDNLPIKLVIDLLNNYSLYNVIYHKVYRHQIYTIIHWSRIEESEKHILKFFYLDSLVLANSFNYTWDDVKQKCGEKIERYILNLDAKLKSTTLNVCMNPHAYWTHDNMKKRLFIEDELMIASIMLEGEKIIFKFDKDNNGNQEEFPFEYSDWDLENFSGKEIRDRLYNLMSSEDGENLSYSYKQMTFSLIYLECYRGVNAQTFDFDYRFSYSAENKELKPSGAKKDTALHFYGKTVYSLSCIVGKNGAGKTSVIDFMRESFYKLLRSVEDFNVSCENGYICEEDYIQYRFLDECTKFLVVFQFGNRDYYLTNIKDINSPKVQPYKRGICQNIDELCKIAYFSPQLRPDQRELFAEGKEMGQSNNMGVSRALDGLRQCDYSEIRSFVRSKHTLAAFLDREKTEREKEDTLINEELCYQFSLMKNLDKDEFCKYLDIQVDKKFCIYNLITGVILDEFTLNDDSSKINELEEKYSTRPDVRIGYFSSGQYAKFIFLAKLYWFLGGYRENYVHYKDLFKEKNFFEADVLQEGETALIFIDEGELYYHPEWQRRYLATLLGMLRKNQMDYRVQIILTTNSPFVISDVLNEDVKYLSGKPEKRDYTLGQNIHTLLKDNFFMDYTIGEYSRELIDKMIGLVGTNEAKESRADFSWYMDDIGDAYENVRLLIQQIGEFVYRDKLERMLNEKIKLSESSNSRQIRELEQEKAKLEKRINELKGGE